MPLLVLGVAHGRGVKACFTGEQNLLAVVLATDLEALGEFREGGRQP